jgi:Flp pilus assembly protein TadB
VAIVTLVLWILTAAAGITLLNAGGARRAQAPAPPAVELPEKTPAGAGAGQRRSTAVPLGPDGRPPPVPHATVTVQAGEHPLLEFAHPALAVAGMAVWFMFTFVHYHPLAWVAFGILVAALSLGLLWLVRNRQAVRDHAQAAWQFPPRLIALHGFAAGVSLALTVLTALIASRG